MKHLKPNALPGSSLLQKRTLTRMACMLLMCFGLSVTQLTGQTQPNVPEGHETMGALGDPLQVDVSDGSEFFTFVNNTDCDVAVRAWMSAMGYTMPHLAVLNIPARSTIVLSSTQVGTAFGLTGSGVLMLTHLSFQFYIPGSTLGGKQDIYPVSAVTNWNSGEAAPCDCVKFTIDMVNRTVFIDPC